MTTPPKTDIAAEECQCAVCKEKREWAKRLVALPEGAFDKAGSHLPEGIIEGPNDAG